LQQLGTTARPAAAPGSYSANWGTVPRSGGVCSIIVLVSARQPVYCDAVGTTKRRRVIVIASLVSAMILIVIAVVAVRAWSVENQREKTAASFAVLRAVDRRIDLPEAIPNMKRVEAGVQVRPLGEGPGPTITYSFPAESTPDWHARVKAAVERAGYGSGDEPWIFRVHGRTVSVTTTFAAPATDGRNYITISID
jgi:hypothetical protein